VFIFFFNFLLPLSFSLSFSLRNSPTRRAPLRCKHEADGDARTAATNRGRCRFFFFAREVLGAMQDHAEPTRESLRSPAALRPVFDHHPRACQARAWQTTRHETTFVTVSA
jgi:hypothetical protein